VAHKFGHRTPADVKLRDVTRHAAAVTDDDDEEEEEDEDTSRAAADNYQTFDDALHHPLIGVASVNNEPVKVADDSVLAADKKQLDDEDLGHDNEPQLTDLRDSTKNDYYQQQYDRPDDDIGGQTGKSMARVATRSSSNNQPSPISDVYFIGT